MDLWNKLRRLDTVKFIYLIIATIFVCLTLILTAGFYYTVLKHEIRQVILNLTRNGFESMATGGVITIKTYVENDQAVIAVSDQGSGIPVEVVKNIGKPFLTTKDNGTGLGLAVSYNIVHRHGGVINIETGAEGTTFVIKLPLILTSES